MSRSTPRHLAVGLLLLVFVAVGATFALERQIGMMWMRRMIAKGGGHPELPDGLHVGLCGSGSPMPDPTRAGPCVLVVAGRQHYIVDVGEGSPRTLALMGVSPASVDAIFLTHFHSDHIGGLGELMLQRWAQSGSTAPIDVFGPQGVEVVVQGFNNAYELDRGYRVAHHGAATMPPFGSGGSAQPFQVPEGRDWSQVVFERGGLRVTAFNVIHTPVFPAVGYRFDYGGRSVVVSGDTAPSEWLAQNARGVDVLFHEALNPTMVGLLHDRSVELGNRNAAKVTADIPSYHTPPEEAARIADEAGAKRLVLYHIIPPLPSSFLDAAFLGDSAAHYKGPITVGQDGLLVILPRGGRGITLRNLL